MKSRDPHREETLETLGVGFSIAGQDRLDGETFLQTKITRSTEFLALLTTTNDALRAAAQS